MKPRETAFRPGAILPNGPEVCDQLRTVLIQISGDHRCHLGCQSKTVNVKGLSSSKDYWHFPSQEQPRKSSKFVSEAGTHQVSLSM